MTQDEFNEAFAMEVPNVSEVIRRSNKLTEDDRLNLSTAASAMQLGLEALGPSIIRGEGAVLMMVSIDGCSIGACSGKIEELRKAVVAVGSGQGDSKQAYAAMLISAALEVSPELKSELLEAISRP